MDTDEREGEKRNVPNVSEDKKKDHFSIFFAQLRALVQAHGYPVKGDREKKLQSTRVLSQNKEVNPATSRKISNWIPSFRSYEDFNHLTLQSLGGFMIILNTDGVIIYVAENVCSVLGYVPNEIVGKKLLSLLPDQEKREVFQKICLKLPVSNSGKHIEFCCHLKRGNIQHGYNIPYEYAKFILTLQDISHEPWVLLSSFFSSQHYTESPATEFPLEDRFYVVGTVCIFRYQILRELLTENETAEKIRIVEHSDEENSSVLTSDPGQGISSEMASPPATSTASASFNQPRNIVEAEQYESQESAHMTTVVESDIYPGTKTASVENTQLSAISPSQNFEFQPEVEDGGDTVEAEQLEQIDQMDEMKEAEQVDEPLQLPSAVVAYINKREVELVKNFKKQLEDKVQMLQADIRNQKDALEMMKEQLNTLKDSMFKMQPTTDNCDPQSLEPCLKKQRTKQTEKSLTDPNETKGFCASYSSHSFIFPEELREPCNASSQTQSTDVPLQLVDKNLGSQEHESQSFSQSPTTYDSDLVILETPQDYIRLWPLPSDPQNRFNIQVKAWPCDEQENQATLPQPRVNCYFSCHIVQVDQVTADED